MLQNGKVMVQATIPMIRSYADSQVEAVCKTVSERGKRLTSLRTFSISILKGEKAMSFNKITIVGYLGRDPELRYTPQGTAVCNMSVATTEKRRSTSGQAEEHTIWFRVTAWGRQAESAAEYLAKGRQVYVEGRLRLEQYTDREGNPRISPEVNATDIHFLGQNGGSMEKAEEEGQIDEDIENEEASKPATPRNGKRATSKRAKPKETEIVGIEKGDIPF
jgi:single-strand DNA-binding protein